MWTWVCSKVRKYKFVMSYVKFDIKHGYKFKIGIVYKQFFGSYFALSPSQFINWAIYSGAQRSIASSLEHGIVI